MAGALAAVAGNVSAGDERRHALSLVNPPRQEAGFAHFDWVDPAAPKGGRVRLRAIGTFDTLNLYAVKGNPASGLNLIHATLLTASLDEPSTDYGLVAAWVSHPPDFSSATFGLRPEARFSDGRAITPEDVVFSFDAIRNGPARYALYYKNVARAEVTGPHEVTFHFDVTGNRELPQIVGGLPVLPRHFWTGTDDKGEARDITRGSLDIPVSSGPYRIAEVDRGRSVTYARVADWWAKDLPVARGQWNFDTLSYIYFANREVAFKEFLTGGSDFWPENSAKGWATGYDVPNVNAGLIIKEGLPRRTLTSMQGFVFNTRRARFSDRRVRQAFNLAFAFETFNKTMFFEQYARVGSYFENSELKAAGLPSGTELAILETVRGRVPDEVFTTEWANPQNHTEADLRANLHQAAKLLTAAGWQVKAGQRRNAAGEKLSVEFLLVQPDFSRLVLAYRETLVKLGIEVEVRVVDAAQYQQRIETFDFDVAVGSFPQSLSPGNEQREYWGSAAAAKEGTSNVIGIADPAVDSLIERLIFAYDRNELIAASRALDRVLLWNHYVVPHFYSPVDRIAYWDKFGRPGRLPAHASALDAFLRVWWQDERRTAALAAKRR